MGYKLNPITGKLDLVAVTSADLSYSNPAYPTLTTIKLALDHLLYYDPSVNSFTNNQNTLEIGSVVNSIDLNWSLNKDKAFLASLAINQGIGNVLPNTSGTSGSLTHVSTFSTNRAYTITMNDGDNVATRNTNIYFNQARFWGKINHKNAPTDAEIMALSGAGIGSGKDLTEQIGKSFDGMDMDGDYFIYAFASSIGEALFKVNGLVNGDFTLVRDNAFTNVLGHTYNIKVYVSNNPMGLMSDFDAELVP